MVVTPLGNGALVRSAGIRRVEELDWWQESKASILPTTLTPAYHFSARTPWDRNQSLWGGFMLTPGDARIFVAGDTAYGPFFRDIRQRLGPAGLALLPIGAYEPRWFMAPQHQNPEEAVQGMKLCNAAYAAGCHWGTFQLTDEPLDEPARKLVEALDAEGVPQERFRALRPGEVWDVPEA